MSAMHEHPSYASRIAAHVPQQPSCAPSIESIADARVAGLATAERSCCCVAKPAVIAFLPAGPGQQRHVDLLLCMHHYRASRLQLFRCGASVIDASGAVVMERDLW